MALTADAGSASSDLFAAHADSFPFVRQKLLEAQARRGVAPLSSSEQPRQLFLPGLEEFMRAMPNHAARSSLFAPIARGKRPYHQQKVLVSRGDATITYTGYQLDEAQADVWMQLMYEAKDVPLGASVRMNRCAFLRAIGRGTSGRDYEWLRSTMIAFTSATLVVEVRKSDGATKYKVGRTRAFHMLSDFDYDADTGTYTFTVDPRWAVLFGGREYALIDWNRRLQIEAGCDMAKAIQRLVATSSNKVQSYSLEWLKEKLQYNSPLRKFRVALLASIDELERVGVVDRGRICCSAKGVEQLLLIKPDGGCG
jgi:hypothetical protein